MAAFKFLAGFALLVVIAAHFSLFSVTFKVAVDKIIPQCFRGKKYGDCEYYKEFYDPISHKVSTPFANDIKTRSNNRIYTFEHNDFDGKQWNFKWKGKILQGDGKIYLDHEEFAPYKEKSDCDKERIAESKSDSENKITHGTKSSIQEKDFTENLQPIA